MKNVYWNKNGKYQTVASQLEAMNSIVYAAAVEQGLMVDKTIQLIYNYIHINKTEQTR